MRENGLMMQKISLSIKAYDLAPCPETRVDCEGALLPYRCSEQELTEILPEDSDRLDIGLLLGLFENFI